MILSQLKTKFNAWREDRFLKKHRCRTRKEYERKHDPDYEPRAIMIDYYYRGYKFVHCFDNHKGYAYTTLYDYGPGGYGTGQDEIYKWCEENLQGKWRCDCLRAIRAPSTSNQWAINEIGGMDHWFFAFKNLEDYFIFKLQWGQ